MLSGNSSRVMRASRSFPVRSIPLPIPPAQPPNPLPKIAITQTQSTLEITIGTQPFTTYRFTETPDHPHRQRPYFYPVLLPAGNAQSAKPIEITSDQMRVFDKDPKADHPHQRSIWIGWGDVNGANHWTQSPEKQRHLKFTKITADSFTEELTWDSKGSTTPVLAETRTVKCLAYPDGTRALDITSTLTAPTVDAVFKCKPLAVSGVEAGIASLRIAKAITDAPDDKKWITSAPDPLPPGATSLLPLTATGEAAARKTPAAWCDYSGLIDGHPFGAALINSPKNSGGLVPFHVRLFGLLADVGPLNFTIKKGDSLTFRHLLLFHPGNAADAHVADRANEWRATQ